MRLYKTLFVLCLLSIACIVNAHESSDSGKASVLIHIDPDDVAVVGKPTTIHIDIENTEKNFSLEGCNCVFTINQVMGEDEKEVFKSTLIPSKDVSIYNIEGIPFTFPKEGEYHINVSGEPKASGLFTPFELEIHEEVLPLGAKPNIASASTHKHKYPIVIIIEAIILTIVMGYFFFSNKKPFCLRN